MKTKLITLLFVAFSMSNLLAQEEMPFEEKMKMKPVGENKYSWAHKHFFFDAKMSFNSELFFMDKKKYTYYDPDDMDTITMTDYGMMYNILGFSGVPRIVLASNNKQALFVKAPVSFGLSVFTGGGIGNKRGGGLNMSMSMAIGYGRGLHSVYNNNDKNGFSISAGYMLQLAPLVGGKTNLFDEIHWDWTPIGEAYKQRKLHMYPVFEFDYYRLNKNKKVRGYSFAINPFKKYYFCFQTTIRIAKK